MRAGLGAEPRRSPVSHNTPLLPSRPLPAGSSRGTLLVLSGSDAGRLAVVGEGLVVGSGEAADFVLDGEGLSRRHARVAVGPDATFYVEDLASTNGTFVAGRRVSVSPLSPGDAIQLGPELVLRFSVNNETDESLQRRLYESAVRDALTGVFNRAYFADRLMVEVAVARRGDEPPCLLMIDVDGLKQLNDRHGHLSGDRALSFVAASIAGSARAGDVVARYGGDEFVILASRTRMDQALVLAERVRQAVARLCFGAGGERVAMTVSIGVASLRELEADARSDGLVALADRRLYAAKHEGRNRVHPPASAAPAASR
jgi:two-component system cell cycle response regulator